MEYINKVILQGTVGSVPKKVITDEYTCTRFLLATNEIFTAKDGTVQEETTWHNIVAWGSKELDDQDLIKKGAKLYVEGKLRNSRCQDSTGEVRFYTEVRSTKVERINTVTPND